VHDLAVFPEDHGDAGAAVFEDGFTEGAIQGGLDRSIAIDGFFDRRESIILGLRCRD